MGSLLRSADMTLVRVYFEHVAAHATIEELGRAAVIQLEDLNPEASSFQRTYCADVQRCEEMQRRLRFLFDEAGLDADDPDCELDLRDQEQQQRRHGGGGPSSSSSSSSRATEWKLDELSVHLASLERSLLQLNQHATSIAEHFRELRELRTVLRTCMDVFGAVEGPADPEQGAPPPGRALAKLSQRVKQMASPRDNMVRAIQLEMDQSPYYSGSQLLGFVSGVIETARTAAFERVLFRTTKGNCFVRSVEADDGKSVFLVFLTGSQARGKVERICAAFHASRYPFPEAPQQQTERLENCLERIAELELVMETTRERKEEMIRDFRTNLYAWSRFVRRQKTIFHAMNMLNFDTARSLYIAEGWVATHDMDTFRDCLHRAQIKSNAQVPSFVEQRGEGGVHDEPPTHFCINKFTSVFQSIIEAYGVAKYHEVNPAPFTVVTFPFLFAVMFGDIGHGIVMTLFALMLIGLEVKLSGKRLDDFVDMCFQGRYIILLMGIFSVYTGFIYNEFFAVPLDLFTSRWKFTNESVMACGIDNCADPAAVLPPLRPYPFGMDPIWKISENNLAFVNSYKMKLSIVLGVLQMVLGIANSFSNARFFKVIFLVSIFGYLVVLIFVKWGTNWNAEACAVDPTCQPPDLKGVLIDMLMAPGDVPVENRLYGGQTVVQVVLLSLALISVPWMLLPRPFLLRRRHQMRKGYVGFGRATLDEDGDRADTFYVGNGDVHSDDGDAPADAFDFQEVFVGQMIHTVEFVLGAVSNTASYLRLWALSLAHAELSSVFLEMLLFGPLSGGHPLTVVLGFAAWFACTLGILLGMEALSAFLHALRLHWVEFQNKFYNLHGPGVKFLPLDFAAVPEG